MHVCMDSAKRCSMITNGIFKCEQFNKCTTISKESLDGTSDKSVDMRIRMNSDTCDGVSNGIYSCLEFGMNGRFWRRIKTCKNCDESCRITIGTCTGDKFDKSTTISKGIPDGISDESIKTTHGIFNCEQFEKCTIINGIRKCKTKKQ